MFRSAITFCVLHTSIGESTMDRNANSNLNLEWSSTREENNLTPQKWANYSPGFQPGVLMKQIFYRRRKGGVGVVNRIEVVLRGSYFKPCSVNFSRPVLELTPGPSLLTAFAKRGAFITKFCFWEIENRISQIANRPRSDAVRIPPRCPGIGNAERYVVK